MLFVCLGRNVVWGRDKMATGRAPCGDRPVPEPGAKVPAGYFTTTFFTAEVFDADPRVTRTRILYAPFLAGAFHLRE